MKRDLYSAELNLYGEENETTLISANNLAASLRDLHHFEEARSLLRKTIPVAQNILGEDHALTLMMKQKCAQSLYRDDGATLDDLREAVTTLVEIGRIARRVLGGAHPGTEGIEGDVERSRAALRARETPSGVATRTRAARARRSEEE